MSEFTDYQERVVDLDSNLYLGRVVWYSLSEQAYADHSEFCRAIANTGMPWGLPAIVRPPDLFRRVTTAAQRRREKTNDPNTFVNFTFREVGSDGDRIWRRLVAETVDTAGRRLSYKEIAEVTFVRSPLDIVVDVDTYVGPWETEMYAAAHTICDGLRDQFNHQYNLLTPYTLREYTRKLLQSYGATLLRDGLYFVREDHADVIAALDTIVNDLPGANFHSLPLVDDRKQRDMLRKAFEDESVGEVDRLLGDMAEIHRTNKKITVRRMAEFVDRYQELRAKVADYSDLLDMAMETTAARLEIMSESLNQMLDNVKDD